MANTSVSEIVQNALVLAGIIDPLEEIDPTYLKQGKNIFDDTLNYLSMLGVSIPYEIDYELNVIAGKKDITIGNGSNFDIDDDPIVSISSAYLKSGDNGSIIIRIIDENIDTFLSVAANGQSSEPNYLFYRYENDFTRIRFHPTPSANLVVALKARKHLKKYNLFDQTIEIPEYYLTIIKYNLASFAADFYNIPLNNGTKQKLDILMGKLKSKNAIPINKNFNDKITSNYDYWFNYNPKSYYG